MYRRFQAVAAFRHYSAPSGESMPNLYDQLIASLLPGKILAVQVGLSRTAILAETDDGIRCGLAATLSNSEFQHSAQPSVCNAGRLHELDYLELAGLVKSNSFTEVSIGLATINTLLPRNPAQWQDLKAEDDLARRGAGKNIVIVGHFPFLERIRPLARNLWVLELEPRDGDLPTQEAPRVIPQADFIAITSTTLINKTFQGLLELRQPHTEIMLLGPSTPLSPLLYEYGITTLSGTIVLDTQATVFGIGQGISLHQLRQQGLVRFVSMKKDA
jgi:uncharacterized protein (DUF4213/DUF364 family)